MARFANGKAPFIRKTDNSSYGTTTIMRDFLIALVPVILFAWYKNGIKVFMDGNVGVWEMLYPLFFILMGGLLAYVMEALFMVATDPENRNVKTVVKKLELSYALIPGLLIAMVLPLYTPVWVLMFGVFMGSIVGKMLFGGFGNNIFNPAILGYLMVGFTLTGVINQAGGLFNASEVLMDAYAGATPLGMLSGAQTLSYDTLVAPYGSLWDFFTGMIPGALAETSALVILISYLWLVARKVISWFTPAIYIGTVFVISWLIGVIVGDGGLWFPTYSILSGGLFFGAVFMATEPVTSPRNPLGKVFFALFLGGLTTLFRFIGVYPEGVATSIIVMNLFTMPMDNVTSVIRAHGLKKPALIRGAALSFGFVLLVIYVLFKANQTYTLLIDPIVSVGGLFR